MTANPFTPAPWDRPSTPVRAEQEFEVEQLRAERDAALARVAELEEELRTAGGVLRDVGKAALVVKPTLTKPYSDAPDQSPWTRFMESPARAAYNLGTKLVAPSRRTDR